MEQSGCAATAARSDGYGSISGRRAASWFFPRRPLRLEVRVRKPSYRLHHGADRLLHVGEINVGHVVTGAVIVLVEPIAGNRLGDDALPRQREVIRALKKML